MKIFDLFKTTPAASSDPSKTLLSMTFKHSKGFRGFKRIGLVTYKDNVAQKNIKKLLDAEISEVTLTVKVDDKNFTKPERFVDVAADGLHIGTHYPNGDNRHINKILNGEIDKVHIRLEDAGDRYGSQLFIHIKEK